MFSIGFTDEAVEYPFGDSSIPAAPGSLTLGISTEDFLANISLWGKEDYQAHWNRELAALMNGSHKIALVVSYDNPIASSNLEIWRVYRDGAWVHFQNQILPYSHLPGDFDIAKISQYIQERVVITSEGNRISEWDVPIRDIESFLSRVAVT